MTQEERIAVYTAIGQAVVDNIPYPDPDLTQTLLAGPPPSTDKTGFAEANDVFSPMSDAKMDAFRESPRQAIWWYYEGEARRVAKAMKIKYQWMYEGKPVTDFILVGFAGWETP